MEKRLEIVEEPGDVGEIDAAVAVEVEGRDRLVGSNPRHLVEEEYDVSEVLPAVAIKILKQTISIRI